MKKPKHISSIIFSIITAGYSIAVSVYVSVTNRINPGTRFSDGLKSFTLFIAIITFVVGVVVIVNCIRFKDSDRIIVGILMLIIAIYQVFLYGALSLSGLL